MCCGHLGVRQNSEQRCWCRGAAAPGTGLGDLKPHKSRLQREKEAWARQVRAKPCDDVPEC